MLQAGVAYVYLCYGMHCMFNVVTGPAEVPQAVLIRAVEPLQGISIMLQRRNLRKACPKISNGPGVLSQALGINREHNQVDLIRGGIQILDDGFQLLKSQIQSGPRVGVAYAGADALRSWRFWVMNSVYVSPSRPDYSSDSNR